MHQHIDQINFSYKLPSPKFHFEKCTNTMTKLTYFEDFDQVGQLWSSKSIKTRINPINFCWAQWLPSTMITDLTSF